MAALCLASNESDLRRRIENMVLGITFDDKPFKVKDLGYGKGYRYAHDYEDKITSMQCLPDSLVGREYYKPTEQGAEGRFKERLKSIKEWKKSHK